MIHTFLSRPVEHSSVTEYRRVTDDDAFRTLAEYGFSPENGPFDPDDAGESLTVGDQRGLYDGEDLLAVCRHYDLSVALRETQIHTGGIGFVTSAPGHRRQGHVRELLTASLAEYRGDRRLALLWPFDAAFYADLGWATVSKLASWEIAADDLAGLAADPPDERDDCGFERLTADDWTRLVPVQRADHGATDLAVRRSEAWWREFVFDRSGKTPFVYGWVVDGEMRAYLVYDIADDVLRIHEQAAHDTDARRHLFRFCRNHDSQVDRIRFYTTVDAVAGHGFDPQLYLRDPGVADATVSAGAMARLVDVAADLPAVAGPAVENVTTAFDLVVTDPIADWNDGRFRVTTSDDELSLERIDGSVTADAASRPTVRLGVGALSQIAVGARSADQLARAGVIEGDDRAITTLGNGFPPRRTALRENF